MIARLAIAALVVGWYLAVHRVVSIVQKPDRADLIASWILAAPVSAFLALALFGLIQAAHWIITGHVYEFPKIAISGSSSLR